LSGGLLVPLGTATEPLNRHWYEKSTGQVGRGIKYKVPCSARSPARLTKPNARSATILVNELDPHGPECL
jgi:hypothetical protein